MDDISSDNIVAPKFARIEVKSHSEEAPWDDEERECREKLRKLRVWFDAKVKGAPDMQNYRKIREELLSIEKQSHTENPQGTWDKGWLELDHRSYVISQLLNEEAPGMIPYWTDEEVYAIRVVSMKRLEDIRWEDWQRKRKRQALLWRYNEMKIKRWNTYVWLEIFRHFVAIEQNGALLLTLVVAPWRDLTLSLPDLWQCVTIDHRDANYMDISTIYEALSGMCPLQIILKLPVVDWKPTTAFVMRWKSLNIECPIEMTGMDVKENTQELLCMVPLPCRIHWFRAGSELLVESREPISIDLRGITTICLDNNGSELPKNLEDLLMNVGSMRNKESHKLLSLTMYRVLEITRNASDLQTFIISHRSMDPASSDVNLPVVTLNRLQVIKIIDISVERHGTISSLLESFNCPNIREFTMTGVHGDVLSLTRFISGIGHPPNLILGFTDISVVLTHLPLVGWLNFILSLELDIFVYRSTQEEISKEIGAFLENFSNLRALRVRLRGLGRILARNDPIIHKYSYDASNYHPPLPKCIHHSSHPGTQKQNIQNLSQSSECITMYVYRIESIILPERHNLRQLDIGIEQTPAPASLIVGTTYRCLTNILCEPFLLIPFLSQHLVETLQSIRLHWPSCKQPEKIEECLLHFDKKITHWFLKHSRFFPRIDTFGLSWFPDWELLQPMVYTMVQGLKMGTYLLLNCQDIPATLL